MSGNNVLSICNILGAEFRFLLRYQFFLYVRFYYDRFITSCACPKGKVICLYFCWIAQLVQFMDITKQRKSTFLPIQMDWMA